jgi:hypothetical protein
MLRKILFFCLLLLLVNCHTNTDSINATDSTKADSEPITLNNCGNSPIKLPNGKGNIFTIDKNKASDLIRKKSTLVSENIIFCEMILNWWITDESNGVIYIVDKVEGFIQKVTIDKLKANLQKEEKIDCLNAILIGKNKFSEFLLGLGETNDEAKKQVNNSEIKVCVLANYYLVLFDFEGYFNLSNLNKKSDLSKLPMVHYPKYLIDKETGEITQIGF